MHVVILVVFLCAFLPSRVLFRVLSARPAVHLRNVLLSSFQGRDGRQMSGGPNMQKPNMQKPNLLETLMSQAGLPQHVLRRPLPTATSSAGGRGPRPMESAPTSDNSPLNQINKLLNTAANSLLTSLTPQRSQEEASSSHVSAELLRFRESGVEKR